MASQQCGIIYFGWEHNFTVPQPCGNSAHVPCLQGHVRQLSDKLILEFKKDRIDNQYYVPITDTEPITKEKCEERLKTAQKFTVEIRTYMEKLTLDDINQIRTDFEKI